MYLNCKTYFSYRYGTIATKDLVQMALDRDLKTLGITNINCTADVWDFVDFCRKENIHPVIGAEVRNGKQFCYLLIAENDLGMEMINRFLSAHLQEDKDFPVRPDLCEAVFIIYPLEVPFAKELKEHERIGIKPAEINKLIGLGAAIDKEKLVIRQPVTFQNKTHFNLHRLMRAIDKNVLGSKLNPEDTGTAEEMFLTKEQLLKYFEAHSFLISQTEKLMQRCNIRLDMKTDKNKQLLSDSSEKDRLFLQKLAMEGLLYRYGPDNKIARDRVIKELRVIHALGFNSYFLIVWDVVQYAQKRGFYYVGRGSGANSIVAFCLRITDVDPVKLDLYFERFLNKFRSSPPDFDMDFSWKDRDEIIDYVFKKYGTEHIALLGMHSTFQHNATIRELGKVFGLPKSEIDILLSQRNPSLKEDSIQMKLLKYGALMKNFPNHLSIHPGGMLISEAPIYTYAAMELPPKGFVTAQIDMFVAEKIGLAKLDILSQRGLGHIKEAIALVKQNRNIDIDIHRVEEFMEDKEVAAQIRKANTIGCFYIESPAMRQLLMKLKCDDYLTLVAASSIIRPGVAQSGMMKQYIHRFHHPDQVEYLHPKMEELLKDTYGVMVYQEDVIKVAHHFAGLEMAEADILRRAMSGKYRGNDEMLKIEAQFFKNCEERGYPEKISKEVWRQIASFAGYSFSKAHSASFAVESYQSLYLKTYFPMEFMVAVINNFGGFYRTEFYFHELKRTGAKVHPPCVNRSENLTSINGNEVFTGFIHIQNLEKGLIVRLLQEREENGPFLGLEDFIERTRVGIEQLNALIRIGAFRFTGMDKKTLLWKANFFQKKQKAAPATAALFHEPPVDYKLPVFPVHALQDALDEIELLGFALTDMFALADDSGEGIMLAKDLTAKLGRQVSILGRLVTTKDIRTITREYMSFGTFLDPEGEWLDTVHFPDSIAQYPFQGAGFYRMSGRVIEEFGVYSVEVTFMKKVGLKQR